jgi:hypothetical protein
MIVMALILAIAAAVMSTYNVQASAQLVGISQSMQGFIRTAGVILAFGNFVQQMNSALKGNPPRTQGQQVQVNRPYGGLGQTYVNPGEVSYD